MAFGNVNRPSHPNRGGMARLLMVDRDDVESSATRILDGYTTTPIQLKTGIQWMEVKLPPSVMEGMEKVSRGLANSLFGYELTWPVAKDMPERIDQFYRMEKKRFVALIQNMNGDWILFGTPEEPARFTWANRNQGRKPTDKNHYQLQLNVKRRQPAPFYRIYATFYVDEEGNLHFDNTFDPTLQAALDPDTSELVLTGPNADKYTIDSDGYLIYTP